MSLRYLSPSAIGSALTCAWKKQLNTSEDPSNGGKWDTNGANNDGIGLYGGLTDSIPASVTFNTNAAQVTTSQIICTTVDVNNTNGLNEYVNEVSLSYQYSTSTTETHTVTESVTEGVKFSFEVNEAVAKEGAEFSIAFTFTSTESETTGTTQTETYSIGVDVDVPAGKVYQAVLTAEVQQITIPYTCIIQVTGTTETWFPSTVNGHYNYSATAGEAFGWINTDDCAGSDSSSYSGNGAIGYVTLTGSVTMTQTVNFTTAVNDVTGK